MSTFRSLQRFNYRTWATGVFISNVGTWMQRTAQDWLVLTELTQHRASAVGVVLSLQFGPQLLLFPITGYAADHLDRRRLLFATQATMGLLAAALGLLTVTGQVALWQVYCFALAHGCVSAFDAPARQSFMSELVGEAELSNAVALNSSSFNTARLLGPAVAGTLIAAVGTGPVFLLNAASFAAVLLSIGLLRRNELVPRPVRQATLAGFGRGFVYVWQRRDLKLVLAMVFLLATFGYNLPIFISTMSVRVFRVGPQSFGVLMSMMAIGSVTGALLSARRPRPSPALLTLGAALFGTGLALAALMPRYALFGAMLVVVGVSGQTFNTTANGLVQLATEPGMRGRVMAIYLAIFLGGTPLGAPIVGWVADTAGPRWSLAVGAAGALSAALLGLAYRRSSAGSAQPLARPR
jgi:MFS family permease